MWLLANGLRLRYHGRPRYRPRTARPQTPTGNVYRHWCASRSRPHSAPVHPLIALPVLGRGGRRPDWLPPSISEYFPNSSPPPVLAGGALPPRAGACDKPPSNRPPVPSVGGRSSLAARGATPHVCSRHTSHRLRNATDIP